jgi:thiol-disulfide isomerase/thioredoxin
MSSIGGDSFLKGLLPSAVSDSSFMSTYGLYILGALAILLIVAGVYFYLDYVKKTGDDVVESLADGSQPADREAELMFFHVDWCPHCKTAKPEWDELKAEYSNNNINGYRVMFTEVNCTEETPEIESMIQKFKIEGYPTIKLVKEGQVIEYDAKPTKSTMLDFLNTVL